MCRAKRKLQLSHNVIGEVVINGEEKEMAGAETGDLRSVIFGLHMIDPSESNNDEPSELNMGELAAMVDKVVAIRHEQQLGKDDRKFELHPMNLSKGDTVIMHRSSASVDFDSGLDEASYLAWVEKLKEVTQSSDDPIIQAGDRRKLPEEKHLKLEAARKKAEEEKLAKWKAHGYNSFSVKDPPSQVDVDMISDLGSVHFVYGDCTHPLKVCPSEAAVIFRQVSDGCDSNCRLLLFC